MILPLATTKDREELLLVELGLEVKFGIVMEWVMADASKAYLIKILEFSQCELKCHDDPLLIKKLTVAIYNMFPCECR